MKTMLNLKSNNPLRGQISNLKMFSRTLSLFFALTLLIFLSLHFLPSAFAVSESDCLNKPPDSFSSGELDECSNILKGIADSLKPAHETNKQQLASLNSQISSLKKRISEISAELDRLEDDISGREVDLGIAQVGYDQAAVTDYKLGRFWDITVPLAAPDLSEALRKANSIKVVIEELRRTMVNYADDLAKLKKDKENLESSRTTLASAKVNLDAQAKFLGSEVEKVETYLATLSAKQQSILAAKSGAFTASVGDSELADDYNASIKGFRESAPSGTFAVFSFGAYTHRKGMSQYGARGRAESNQLYRQILNAYFGKEPVNKDTGGDILVDGVSMNFEDRYLLGIAEMPSTWHPEALKAQAVAARTYAYRYKIEGKSICSSESCQVFRTSKADNPPDAWRQAVQDTRGQVLEDVTTFYSSTAGGYLTTLGWDTTDGGGGSDFINKTWESKGGSPWLYKAWYREGYSASGATCGKSNPWLTREELADIINAALILKNRDDDRITPVTTSCWGGNPYSYDELRNQASSYGGISSVSSVYVTQGTGATNQVVVNGNIYLAASEFKQAFNLRAPGYLRIPQSGFAFFNIESK